MTTSSYAALALVIILLGIIADPFMLFMPGMDEMLLLLAAAVLAIVYAGFVLAEKGGDERDLLHRSLAGRAGFLSGIAALTLALVVEGLSHHIDPWIPFALIVIGGRQGCRPYVGEPQPLVCKTNFTYAANRHIVNA